MSQVTVALLAAAAALSVVEFMGGQLWVRLLANRFAVRRWLLYGAVRWSDQTRAERRSYRFAFGLARNHAFRRVQTIIDSDLARLLTVAAYTETAADPQDRLDSRLRTLAAGGIGWAIYRLEADQLAAQVSAAAEMALNSPARNKVLLVSLAAIKMEYLKSDETLLNFLQAERVDTKDSQTVFASTRRDLAFRIHRRIDDLQIKTRGVQEVVDHALFIVVATLATYCLSNYVSGPIPWQVLGPVAGLLSPLMRRVIRAIGR